MTSTCTQTTKGFSNLPLPEHSSIHCSSLFGRCCRPDIVRAAAASGLSVRSLQRYLAAAGLTYSKLVDQVRFKRAAALLQQPDVKLLEVAMELGYTDPANFARAFRRWAGVSPREYRLLFTCSRSAGLDRRG